MLHGEGVVLRIDADLNGSDSEFPVWRHSSGNENSRFMSLRIVVIDDNVDLVDSLLSVLEHLGHDAYGATRGDEGVQLVDEKRPDVALVDVGMPGMSGFDVAAQIRRQSWGHAIILIALTGWGRDEDRELCRDAGFDHVALKPVDLDYLQVMLARVSTYTPHSVPAVTQAARMKSFDAARP
jgi:CheY-like chemotaxis protein